MNIAIVNASKRLTDTDVIFHALAAQKQIIECAQDWNLTPYSVDSYRTEETLPAKLVYLFRYVDKLDVDGALAYHGVNPAGRPYGDMLAPDDPLDAVGLTHEIGETLCDETCDRWVKTPEGREVAAEIADPVQGDWYEIPVTAFGETRQIKVSSWVTPRWFGATDSGPYDHLGKLSAPFSMLPGDGGYMVVIDSTGNEQEVFARVHGDHLSAAVKTLDSGSRFMRRLRGKR